MTASPVPRFPDTRVSVVASLASASEVDRRAAYGRLIDAYWQPVYTYLRWRHRLTSEDAEDLTQAYFTHVLEKGTLARFEAEKARFRTWLRVGLDRFASNEHRAVSAQKRGGGETILSLADFRGAEEHYRSLDIPVEADPEEIFHREWLRRVIALAVDDLERDADERGRPHDFAIFRALDLDAADAGTSPTYAALAARHELPETSIPNIAHRMRGRFRAAVRRRMAGICATEGETRAELDDLGGDR